MRPTTYLLGGLAVVAALAISAPSWAAGREGDLPNGGNTMGVAGPNPGGPSAMSGSAPHTATMHHANATHHARKSRRQAPLSGTTADQLNQQEMARLQAGAPPPPPVSGADTYMPQGPRPSGH